MCVLKTKLSIIYRHVFIIKSITNTTLFPNPAPNADECGTCGHRLTNSDGCAHKGLVLAKSIANWDFTSFPKCGKKFGNGTIAYTNMLGPPIYFKN